MRIAKIIRSFREDDNGVIAIELVFVVPILVWALLSTFVYFDVYRAKSISTRAAITIADMISREEIDITEEYLDGAQELLKLLTEVDDDPKLRVTVFWYDEDNDRMEIGWSYNRGYDKNLGNAQLVTLRSQERIPRMAALDRAILVETSTEYTAAFSYAMGPFAGSDLEDVSFDTYTIIRPRTINRLCYDAQPSNPAHISEC